MGAKLSVYSCEIIVHFVVSLALLLLFFNLLANI